jgi:hypothetical protein
VAANIVEIVVRVLGTLGNYTPFSNFLPEKAAERQIKESQQPKAAMLPFPCPTAQTLLDTWLQGIYATITSFYRS